MLKRVAEGKKCAPAQEIQMSEVGFSREEREVIRKAAQQNAIQIGIGADEWWRLRSNAPFLSDVLMGTDPRTFQRGGQ